MAKKKKAQKVSPVWRIVISLVGAALILIAASQFLLFLFGETTGVHVSTRRQGGANDGATSGQRYTWSLDYFFEDQNGVTHNGTTTRRGSDMSVNVDNKVYYFTFAPVINALESDAKPKMGQLIYCVLGVLLIYVMNRKEKATGKKAPPTRKIIQPDDLTDYDDSVEEQFHQR